ncbi:hypothetical protein GCM10022393_03600 [Aquimarina addita]|uniref:M23ase beta-sheet core domain-containing protein n=2 Tax=Aquimarina addita TaxID=870485 RepID=A0ABP7XAB9_9FLAO
MSMLSVYTFAQENFKVYYEEIENGYAILADNGEYSPVSMEITFETENLASNIGDQKILVIPAQTDKFHIADLSILNKRKGIKIGYSIRYNHGNHLQKKYDKEYAYHLPFKKGETFTVTQGYNGAISHKDEYALDFRMPIGTEIYASRDGVVVLIEEGYNKTCTSADCAKFNNYILIHHSDGTFAEYTHLKKNGSIVKPGDHIQQGQLIGYSGNVGWSTGPHLHFIVFIQRLKTRETLPTKFLIGNIEGPIQLQEKVAYTKGY